LSGSNILNQEVCQVKDGCHPTLPKPRDWPTKSQDSSEHLFSGATHDSCASRDFAPLATVVVVVLLLLLLLHHLEVENQALCKLALQSLRPKITQVRQLRKGLQQAEGTMWPGQGRIHRPFCRSKRLPLRFRQQHIQRP
jgi:hypothetical protein